MWRRGGDSHRLWRGPASFNNLIVEAGEPSIGFDSYTGLANQRTRPPTATLINSIEAGCRLPRGATGAAYATSSFVNVLFGGEGEIPTASGGVPLPLPVK